jgi:hypothetical protein
MPSSPSGCRKVLGETENEKRLKKKRKKKVGD